MNNEKKNPFENPIVQQRFLGGSIALFSAGFLIVIMAIWISGPSGLKKEFTNFKLMFSLATLCLVIARVKPVYYILPSIGLIVLFAMDTFWGF